MGAALCRCLTTGAFGSYPPPAAASKSIASPPSKKPSPSRLLAPSTAAPSTSVDGSEADCRLDEPDESYPKTDAAERAEAVQAVIFAAAAKEAEKPTDSLALNLDPKWEKNGGKAIEAVLASTGLIDAQYLINLARYGGALPRCEQVPAVAWIGPKQAWRLKSWSGFGSSPVLAISAGWLDPDHPDKRGATLRKVLPVLQALVATARTFASHEHATIGVMWDVCCVPQLPPSTSAEQEVAERSRQDHARCLAHSAVHVLLVTTEPPRGGYRDRRRFEERGWSFVEERLSCLLKFDDCLWDLTKLEGAVGATPSYASMLKLARRRAPPMSPRDLEKELRQRKLYFRDTEDGARAVRLYSLIFSESFDQFFSSFPARKKMLLCYKGRGFNDADAATLAEALSYAAYNCKLPSGLVVHALTGNRFSPDAVELLKEKLKKTSLKIK